MSTIDPLSSGDAAMASAVHRRLARALADLGIAPQPIGPRVQNWTNLTDGVITFGALSVTTAARLANLLEDIAGNAGASSAVTTTTDDEASVDFPTTFEPVAAPLDPAPASSRVHPRMHR